MPDKMYDTESALDLPTKEHKKEIQKFKKKKEEK